MQTSVTMLTSSNTLLLQGLGLGQAMVDLEKSGKGATRPGMNKMGSKNAVGW